MSTPDPFIIHSAEQVLRFSRADQWDDLSEARKVQLGFNMGVLALGLGLSKEESFMALTDAREGRISMNAFRNHLLELIASRKIPVDQGNVVRSF
jgi:hypothetical protein